MLVEITRESPCPERLEEILRSVELGPQAPEADDVQLHLTTCRRCRRFRESAALERRLSATSPAWCHPDATDGRTTIDTLTSEALRSITRHDAASALLAAANTLQRLDPSYSELVEKQGRYHRPTDTPQAKPHLTPIHLHEDLLEETGLILEFNRLLASASTSVAARTATIRALLDAADDLSDAIAPRTSLSRGWLEWFHGDNSAVPTNFERAERLATSARARAIALTNLSTYIVDTADLQAARRIALLACHLDPSIRRAHMNCAILHQILANPAKARQHFSCAVKLSSEYDLAPPPIQRHCSGLAQAGPSLGITQRTIRNTIQVLREWRSEFPSVRSREQ